MDCAAVKPRMEALVNGSLPPSEREPAEQHIAMCEGCRLELELVRAIGSQEKAPAVGKDDWTLDRIFGAEDGSSGGSEQGSPSVAGFPAIFPSAGSVSPSSQASAREAAAAKSGSEPVADEEGAKAPDAASWDFEPADAKSHVKPPLESLFFATEALTRRKGSEKKSSNLRVILWGAGGLVGAALLVFSSWFVLHMSSPDPGDG